MSGHEALLGRLFLKGRLTSEQKQELHQQTFPAHDPDEVCHEQYMKAAVKLVERSGITELEQVQPMHSPGC